LTGKNLTSEHLGSLSFVEETCRVLTFRKEFCVDEGIGLCKEAIIIYQVLDSSVHLGKLSAGSEVGHLHLVGARGSQKLLFLELQPLQDSLLSFVLHFGNLLFRLFELCGILSLTL